MADKNYSIGYKFTGDASGFTRTMGEMNRSLGSVEKSVNALKSLSGVFAAIGTAIVVAKKAMNSTEGSADSLEKAMAIANIIATNLPLKQYKNKTVTAVTETSVCPEGKE